MARSKRNINVGAAVRASDVQAIANVAAAADDAALEIVLSPAQGFKQIVPLLGETQSRNPRMLVVGKDIDGSLANGKVRVRPAYYQAPAATNPQTTVALGAKQAANLDSPAIANNSSGVTRTDLLYATISYGTPTSESVRKKPLGGGQPQSTPLTTQYDILIAINVVAGVSSTTPAASLPADDTVNGVYNFALAALSIPNGFTGGAINQSAITPLWAGGFTPQQRIRGLRPLALCLNGASESVSQFPLSSRWGSFQRAFAPAKLLPSTPTAAGGVNIDDSIDWRHRIIRGTIVYLGSATTGATLDSDTRGLAGTTKDFVMQTGAGGAGGATMTYSGAATVTLQVDAGGTLNMWRGGTLVDGTNGDLILIFIEATDQLSANVI